MSETGIEIVFGVEGGSSIEKGSGLGIKEDLEAIAKKISKRGLCLDFKMSGDGSLSKGSGLRIHNQLKTIVQQINAHPIELDFKLKNINDEVQAAVIKASKTKSKPAIQAQPGIIGTNSDDDEVKILEKNSKEYLDVLNKIHKIRSTILKKQSSFSAANVDDAVSKETYNKYKSLDSTLVAIENNVKTGTAQAKAIDTAIASVNETMSESELIIRQSSEAFKDNLNITQEATKALYRYRSATNEQANISSPVGRLKEMSNTYSLLNEDTNASEKVKETYSEIESKIRSLTDAKKRFDNAQTVGEAKKALGEITKISGSIDDLDGRLLKLYDDLEARHFVIAPETEATINKLHEMSEKFRILDSESASGAQKNAYTGIAEKIKALQEANVAFNSARSEDEAKKAARDIEKIIGEVNKLENNLDDMYQKAKASQELLKADTPQGQTALIDINKRVEDITRSLEKFSAAGTKGAKSFGAYKTLQGLRDQFIALDKKVRTGEITIDSYNKELRELTLKAAEATTTIRVNGEAHLSTADKIKNATHRMGAWLSASTVVMRAYNSMRMMLQMTIQLDDAMTQLKVVTNASSAAYAEFADNVSSTAVQIGASITDLVNSATTYARLGYSLDESGTLSKYTAMLKNVGDIDVGEAQNAITAITKAFDIPAEQIESVMDKLVTTGNNFPISVAQIAEGMNNASSALAATGNSFEESVALLTAANTTIQNASKSSTGLRTIAARIRNTKSELEELGEEVISEAKYNELVSSLTKYKVSLVDINGEYRSTYDIISDIAKQWDNMSSMEQASLASSLAGVRQQAVFYSLIGQFKEASGAMDAMKDSAGTLESAYSTYMGSITAHTTALKSEFQSLGANIFDTSLVKMVVDIGRGLLGILNTLEKLHALLPSIVGVVALIRNNPLNLISNKSTETINGILAEFTSAGKLTEELTVKISGLTKAERIRTKGLVESAVASKDLSKAQAELILKELGLDKTLVTTSTILKKTKSDFRGCAREMKNATGASTKFSIAMKMGGVAARGFGEELKLLWASMSALEKGVLIFTVIAEAISFLNKHVKTLAELNTELKDMVKNTTDLSQKYQAAKETQEKYRDELASFDGHIDISADNLGLSEEAYKRYVEISKEIIEVTPNVRRALDSNGNEVVYFGNNVTDANEEYEKLLKSMRDSTNLEISKTLPDAMKNLKKQTEGLNRSLEAYEHHIEVVKKGSGDKDVIASQEAEINNIKQKINEKYASVIPIIQAKIHVEPVYDGLDETSRKVADILITNLDFSQIEDRTAEGIQNYINNAIINPLNQANLDGAQLTGIFEDIQSLKSMYNSGALSAEEFAARVHGAFGAIAETMSDEQFNAFANVFIGAMNNMGFAGSDFDAVINSIINDWGLLAQMDGNINLFSGLDSSKISEFSSAISSVTGALTKLADLQDAVGDSFIVSLDKALEFATIYPEILNGAEVAADGQLKLNEDVVNGVIEGKQAEVVSSVDAAILKLKSEKEVAQSKLDLAETQLKIAQAALEGEGDMTKEEAEYRVKAGNEVSKALIESGVDEVNANRMAQYAMIGDVESFKKVANETATDLDGNFNQAAYNAAMGIYDNMNNAKLDLSSVAAQAHQSALAVSGVSGGKQRGSSRIQGGSRGGKNRSGNVYGMKTKPVKYKSSYSYTPKEISLKEFSANLELDIGKYQSEISRIDGQIAALEALKNKPLKSFSSKKTGGSKGSGGSGGRGSGGRGSGGRGSSSSSSSQKEDLPNWFEEQYKLHNHLVNMNAESVKDYLLWLEKAHAEAYSEGIITLDDYRKYNEEVYNGLINLFKDYMNDMEHEIDMRKRYEADTKKVYKMYEKLIKDVEKEIKEMRARGLDDNDDYIQELQKKWAGYVDARKEMEEKATDDAKNAVEKLIDIRLNMLKQDIQNEKDAINKKLTALKEFYDKQKQMLQDTRDEEKYLEEQKAKRKSVTDYQEELNRLEYDDSAWAQRRKLELAQELATAQNELESFEKDHALQETQDKLDKQYEQQEEAYNKQLELLEEKANNAKALYDQALADIKNGNVQLYEDMIEYNNRYGDGIEATIKNAWEEAYKSLQKYKDLFDKMYGGVNLENATGYKPKEESWDKETVSGKNPNNKVTTKPVSSSGSGKGGGGSSSSGKTTSKAPSLSYGSSIKVKGSARKFSKHSGYATMAPWVPGGTYTVYETYGKEVLIGKNGVYTGWINRSDIVGYAKGTKSATKGVHRIDEQGAETIFESADGSKYKMFSGGEKVLNAGASNFLYDFANNGQKILSSLIGAVNSLQLGKIGTQNGETQINMGDIIVQGNANERTVSEIRRAQRDAVSGMIKSLNSLNR